MTEKVITVTFDVESEAYQAINGIKRDYAASEYVVSHVTLVKNTGGHIIAYDNFDSGVETTDDTAMGGLVGALVGILGGPLGIILGGSTGLLIGNLADTSDALENASLLEQVSSGISDGKTALLILAQENGDNALDRKFSDYNVEIKRFDAAEVAAEVEEARHLQREMAKEARARLREEKKEERRQKVKEKQEEIRSKFDAFKEKYFS